MPRSFRVALLVFLSLAWLSWMILARYHSAESPVKPYVEGGVGDVVCRPDGHLWTSSGDAFVIVGSATCAACSLSKPFEEELDDYAKQHGIPIFYVLANGPQGDQRERELRAQGKTVIRTNLHDFGITGIPAFLRVNDRGVIQSMRSGTVPNDVHEKILRSLVAGNLQAYKKVTAAEVPLYAANAGYQVLALSDIGTRESWKVTTIPVKELTVRAKYELNPQLGVVIDCNTILSPLLCHSAALTLAAMQFEPVIAAGIPSRANKCGEGSR